MEGNQREKAKLGKKNLCLMAKAWLFLPDNLGPRALCTRRGHHSSTWEENQTQTSRQTDVRLGQSLWNSQDHLPRVARPLLSSPCWAPGVNTRRVPRVGL